MQTRRDFLKFAAMVTGAAGATGMVSESVQRAYAIEPAPGSTFLDAEHVVILMQENRSFDHTFGTLRGVRGFNDPRALRLANGNSVFVQTNAKGESYAPWRLDIRDTRVTWMGSLPHSRNSQVDAWNEGRQDGWLEAKRPDEQYAALPLTMGHYTREDLPLYYELADAFTVCDQNYCSVMTSTSPNRSVFWTGTIRETQSVDAKVHMRNEQIDDGGMTWTTYPERLQAAGVSWKSYQNELTRSGLADAHDSWLSNFGDNILECFNAYNVEAYPGYAHACQREIAELTAGIAAAEAKLQGNTDAAAAAKLQHRIAGAKQRKAAVEATLADSGEARYQRLSDQQRALHHAAFVTNANDAAYHDLHELPFEAEGKAHTMQVPKGDVLYQFRKDVEEGKLPAVSWLTAPENFSDHPSAPWYGAWYVSEVMDILTKNPEVWKKTIFILTYDENDGYFDHAPSFVAADPKRAETGGASAGIETGLEYTYREDELRMGVAEAEARGGPIGMGFRVPMIVASPWSRGGWVNSQLFDHTSTLMFLEKFVQGRYGKTVREENISAWRRAISGDLTSVFRPYDPKEPTLQTLDRDGFVVGIERAKFKDVPANYKKLTAEQVAAVNAKPRGSEWLVSQEPGMRPACALPYELHADGRVSADGKSFEVEMGAGAAVHGAKAAGAPFNVYVRGSSQVKDQASGFVASSYAVKAGDRLVKRVPLAEVAGPGSLVEVVGVNGFYRAFAGPGAAAGAGLEVRVAGEPEGARVRVHLLNRASGPVVARLEDRSYGAAAVTKQLRAGQTAMVVMDLARSHGWYDFAVMAEGVDGASGGAGAARAESRYAGRVESGKHGMSDPAMA